MKKDTMMHKIRFNIKNFYCILVISHLIICCDAAGQAVSAITDKNHYKEIVINDSLQKMVEVKTLLPSVVYDLHYATKNNFVGKRLYRNGNQTFLRLIVARALQNVQE